MKFQHLTHFVQICFINRKINIFKIVIRLQTKKLLLIFLKVTHSLKKVFGKEMLGFQKRFFFE